MTPEAWARVQYVYEIIKIEGANHSKVLSCLGDTECGHAFDDLLSEIRLLNEQLEHQRLVIDELTERLNERSA